MLFYCQLLLNFQGSYIDFYVRSFSKLVIDYEMGNWEEIDKDIKSLKILRNIPDIYIQAVKTTDDIVKFIKE